MTKELKWRLGKLPSPEEVVNLINSKIITKEEAREILFRTEDVEEKSTDDLKSEIKFLKEVIEKLSTHQSIVKVIEQIQYPVYIQKPWYPQYQSWLTTCQSTNIGAIGNGTMYLSGGITNASNMSNAVNCAFTSIGN